MPTRPLSNKTLIDEAVDRHGLKLLAHKVDVIEFDDDGRALAFITRSNMGRRCRVETAHLSARLSSNISMKVVIDLMACSLR